MIIICPECSTRYVVAGSSVGDKGRIVKCANCAHQWFQDGPKKKATHKYQDDEPDLDFDGIDEPAVEDDFQQKALPDTDDKPDDEPESVPNTDPDFEKVLENIADEVAKIDAEEDFDSIPDAVKPIPEEEDESQQPRAPINLPNWSGMAAGYGAAFAVLFVMVGALTFMKNTVVSFWPASAIVYETFGADVKYAGEGLIFDRVNAKTELKDGQNILKLSGTVINLKPEETVLPPILASLQGEGGETAASWIIDPGSKTIDAESAIPFDMEYELADQQVTNASVMFLARLPETDKPEENVQSEVTVTSDMESKSDDHHKGEGH